MPSRKHEKAIAGGKGDGDRIAPAKVLIKPKEWVDTILHASAPGKLNWFPVLMITAVWSILRGYGWVVSEANGWTGSDYGTTWTVIGGIDGLIIGLALWWTEIPIKWKQILFVILGWTIAMSLGGAITTALYQSDAPAINGTIRGAIGGLGTGLALRWAKPSIQWTQILIIAIGWIAGCTIGQAIGPGLYNSFDPAIGGNTSLWFIPGAITGVAGGAIGSVVMYWQQAK